MSLILQQHARLPRQLNHTVTRWRAATGVVHHPEPVGPTVQERDHRGDKRHFDGGEDDQEGEGEEEGLEWTRGGITIGFGGEGEAHLHLVVIVVVVVVVVNVVGAGGAGGTRRVNRRGRSWAVGCGVVVGEWCGEAVVGVRLCVWPAGWLGHPWRRMYRFCCFMVVGGIMVRKFAE